MIATFWGDWFTALVNRLKEFLELFLTLMRVFGDVVLQNVCEAAVALFPSLSLTGLTATLDKINYFFPLSEGITLCAGVFSVWLAVWIYKGIKSWIPTVSS